jgi:hypothetical protein
MESLEFEASHAPISVTKKYGNANIELYRIFLHVPYINLQFSLLIKTETLFYLSHRTLNILLLYMFCFLI